VARKSINSQRIVAELLEQVGRFAHGDAFLKGLNPAQWAALRYFARANRVSRIVSAFALYHGTTRGTATQTVKALVEKGCLRRRPVIEDDPFRELVAAAAALSSKHCSTVAEGLEIMLGRLLAKRGRPGVCSRSVGALCSECVVRAGMCMTRGTPSAAAHATSVC
jgi:DNA-binding MarR family transcriptional regulator